MPTVKSLREECKKLGIKGYSKLKKEELIQVIKKGKKKGLEKIIEHKKLAPEKSNQVQQYFQQTNLTKYCNDILKNKFIHPFMKAEISMYLPYFNWSKPQTLHTDKMEKKTGRQGYVPRVYLFFEKERQQQFLPIMQNKSISVRNFIDPVWLNKQNLYLDSLTPYQRAIIFAYTNNSFDSIMPYCLFRLKSETYANKKLEDIWAKYKKWVKNKQNYDAVTLGFYFLCHNNIFFRYSFNYSEKETLAKMKKKTFDYETWKNYMFQHVSDGMFGVIMDFYLQELFQIFEYAPAVEKSFYVYRIESDAKRFQKYTFANETFLSCSNDATYIRSWFPVSGQYIRFKICPGTKVLFIKGLSYYEKENEFLLAPSELFDISKMEMIVTNNIEYICSDRKKVIDVKVRPLQYIPDYLNQSNYHPLN
jgi:hypothetical protein